MCSNLRNWPVFSSLEPKFTSEIHMVMVFGELGKMALIVTKDKKVYLMNDNLHALESRDKSSTMLYLKEIKDLCGKDIKTFAYGRGSHMLALTNGGEVYSCDNIGQLKNGTFNMDLTFTLINIPTIQDSQNMKHVVDIACGNKHSIILTNNDECMPGNQIIVDRWVSMDFLSLFCLMLVVSPAVIISSLLLKKMARYMVGAVTTLAN